MAALESIHVYISGHVQGVGFRYHTQREAKRLGLSGWVRNLPDGRVEVWAEGESAQLDELLKWCGKGPQSARVDHVGLGERGPLEGIRLQRFDIR